MPPFDPQVIRDILRPKVAREKPYVYLGASDSPIDTELLVRGRDLKSSLGLCGQVSCTWLAVLDRKLQEIGA